MLVLKCKSCGSFDLEKNEDIFICQYCSTKHILSDFTNESYDLKSEQIKYQTIKDLETARMKNAFDKEQRNGSFHQSTGRNQLIYFISLVSHILQHIC